MLDLVRKNVFNGKMSDKQMYGTQIIIDTYYAFLTGNSNIHELSYMLATAYHESNATMWPVVENLNYTTPERIKRVWPKRFKTAVDARPYVRNPIGLANFVYGDRNGNYQPNDGWDFRGRGVVQLTGRGNYQFATNRLAIDLVGNPDSALIPMVSAQILVIGMSGGWFTGYKTGDFFKTQIKPEMARQVVNPDNNGALIEGYYNKFLSSLPTFQ